MHKVLKGKKQGQEISSYQLQDNLFELAQEMEVARGEGREEKSAVITWESQMDMVLKQSEEILDVARAEAEKIKEEARQIGYNAGLMEGKDDGYWQAFNENEQQLRNNREEIKDILEDCIKSFEVEKQILLEKHLDELKNISVAIAEKVMRVSLQSSGDIIKRMIEGATEKLSRSQWVKIYISKYDAEFMAEGDVRLLKSLSYLSDNIKIITMEREEQGTCIIELPKEIIDASINTQMENIRGILNNVQL